jgi:hypothetical protein
MATVFVTTIQGCRVTTQGDLTDVVKDVNCVITGTDDLYPKCTFELPVIVTFGPADPATFTPFSSITEEEMLDWVNAQTDQLEPVQSHINMVVQKEVALADLEPMPLPWAPPTPPTPPGPGQP